MSNGFQNDAAGGIKFSTPIFSFGNTQPAVNSGYSFDLPMATIQSFSNNALSFTQNNASLNRGFLDNVISRSQGSVTATADNAYEYQKSALGTLSGISTNMRDSIDNATSSRGKGFCFITTAICEGQGKEDDCDELQILRKFRDEYMLSGDPDLKKDVDLYYEIAPDIVEKINARKDAKQIYDILRGAYLLPAITHIQRGENKLAHRLYVEMVRAANEFALEKV